MTPEHKFWFYKGLALPTGGLTQDRQSLSANSVILLFGERTIETHALSLLLAPLLVERKMIFIEDLKNLPLILWLENNWLKDHLFMINPDLILISGDPDIDNNFQIEESILELSLADPFWLLGSNSQGKLDQHSSAHDLAILTGKILTLLN